MVSAKLVVLTVPAADDQITIINHLRQSGSETLIVGNAQQYDELRALYQAGADFVMMPHLVGGDWIANILTKQQWSRETFKGLRAEQRAIWPHGAV